MKISNMFFFQKYSKHKTNPHLHSTVKPRGTQEYGRRRTLGKIETSVTQNLFSPV